MVRTILLSVAFAAWCEARVGDTLQQCNARYGEPVEVSEPNERYREAFSGYHHFRFEGFAVSAIFDKAGRCVYVTYKHQSPGRPQKLTREECERLLALNGAGKEWDRRKGKTNVDPGEHITQTTIVEAWGRKDGLIRAWYKEQKAAKNNGDMPAKLNMSVFGCQTAQYDALMQELNRKAESRTAPD